MVSIVKFLSDAGVSLDVIKMIENQMVKEDVEINVQKSKTRLYGLAWSAFLDDVCQEHNVDPAKRIDMRNPQAGQLGGWAMKKCFERGKKLFVEEYKEKIRNDHRFDGWY